MAQDAEYRGEVLKLNKISRLDMGTYICTANNGNNWLIILTINSFYPELSFLFHLGMNWVLFIKYIILYYIIKDKDGNYPEFIRIINPNNSIRIIRNDSNFYQ